MRDEFADRVSTFLKTGPSEEALFAFCDEHGNEPVLRAIAWSLSEIDSQFAEKRARFKSRVLDCKNARERAEEEADYERWRCGANRFKNEMIKTRSTIRARQRKTDGASGANESALTAIHDTLQRIECLLELLVEGVEDMSDDDHDEEN